MEPWVIGLIAVLVIGVAVIAYGAVHDRNRNRRTAALMQAPPARSIPGFDPPGTPRYVTALQARRPPADVAGSALTDQEREAIRSAVSTTSTVTVQAGYLSKDFVTDPPSGWATLAAPQILLCAEPIRTVRELLVALERPLRAGTSLVVAAPAYSPDVRATLEVNVIQRKIPLVAVRADEGVIARLAAATGASPVPRSDLQAGFLPETMLGHCARWVATGDQSHVILTDPRVVHPGRPPEESGHEPPPAARSEPAMRNQRAEPAGSGGAVTEHDGSERGAPEPDGSSRERDAG